MTISVIQYDLQMNFIKEWPSMTEASKSLKIHVSNISRVCVGHHKSTHGFIFKFK